MKTKRPATPSVQVLTEETIRQSCVGLLLMDGWENLRTDPCSDRARAKGFGEKGLADDQFIRYRTNPGGRRRTKVDESVAQVIWIEWKKTLKDGSFTKPAAHQTDWHRDARIRGAVTFIAGEDFPANIEGFTEWYKRTDFWRNPPR